MCGIVGGVSLDSLPECRVFEEAAALLAHRGPDDSGSCALDRGGVSVRLHHRRLSIIDLSPAGRQPMSNEDGSVRIIFNGEIYNYVELRQKLTGSHRFASESDTEVILRLYEERGAACLAELNGMFALAIWDAPRQELILARDRAGMKPLYYWHRNGEILFASELKALSRLTGRLPIDRRSMFVFFDLGYVPHGRSIVEGIRQIPQGCYLRWSRGEVEEHAYWKPPLQRIDQRNADDRFDELLSGAVKIHCRSDVELGLFLSGGLDSSCLLAAMHEHGFQNVRTFSVSFPGMGHYDEGEYAAKVARMFGARHERVEITPDAAAVISRLPAIFDEPFADPSAIPTYYLSEFASRHVKVALTGTGGDDVMAGYRKYQVERLRRRLGWIPSPLLGAARAFLGLLPATRRTSLLEEVLLARRFLASLAGPARLRYLATLRPMEEALLLGLFTPDAIERAGVDAERLRGDLLPPMPGSPSLHDALCADFVTYLSGDLLVKEDRLAMHFSLEGRMPFLDAQLADFCLALPDHLLLEGGTGKHILRRWARSRLPDEIVSRKKHGFGVPLAEWLREPLKHLGEETIRTVPDQVFNRRAWQDLWAKHQSGHEDYSQTLYNLITFNGWLQSSGPVP
ncbi:MAG: asparagine synthase (glutamine-hydrolyzing) [Acidobacteria bacterium]|nr:asparagine synthase (glutamine-hydrolyzing) [Acidobacteriota bacterium]